METQVEVKKKRPDKALRFLYYALSFFLILIVILYFITSARLKNKTSYDTVESSASALVQITKDCFAPDTKEQYEESHNTYKELFTEQAQKEFYTKDSSTIMTGIKTRNIDVVYSYINDSNDCMYRVTLDLVGDTGTTNLDVYYYVGTDGKINKVIALPGGNERV